MKICDGVHQIKVNFRVTEQVCRYVYIYLIEGKYCYLVDTGVYGSEGIIADYMHRIGLEDNLTVQVMNTGGHSVEELSYLLVQKGILFTGDSIPVKGDIPIYVNQRQSLRSLERMKEAKGIQYYCPAWDKIYDRQEGIAALEAGRELIVWLDQAVRKVRSEEPALTAAQVTERVCSRHGLEMLMQNPLFQRTVACHMHEQISEEMTEQE